MSYYMLKSSSGIFSASSVNSDRSRSHFALSEDLPDPSLINAFSFKSSSCWSRAFSLKNESALLNPKQCCFHKQNLLHPAGHGSLDSSSRGTKCSALRPISYLGAARTYSQRNRSSVEVPLPSSQNASLKSFLRSRL